MAAYNFSFTIREVFAPVVARTRKALEEDHGFAIDITDGTRVQGVTDELRTRYENLRAAVAAVPELA